MPFSASRWPLAASGCRPARGVQPASLSRRAPSPGHMGTCSPGPGPLPWSPPPADRWPPASDGPKTARTRRGPVGAVEQRLAHTQVVERRQGWCSGRTAPTGRARGPGAGRRPGYLRPSWSASCGGSSPITSACPDSSAGSAGAGIGVEAELDAVQVGRALVGADLRRPVIVGVALEHQRLALLVRDEAERTRCPPGATGTGRPTCPARPATPCPGRPGSARRAAARTAP